MPYLLRDRLGTYDFRRAVPAGLRPVMPAPWTDKANWKVSLRTKLTADAKKAGARTLRDCMADFEAAVRAQRGESASAPSRSTLMPSVEEIERDVPIGLLKDDEALRTDGDSRRHLQTTAERAPMPDLVAVPLGRRGAGEDYAHALGLEQQHAEYRAALSRSSPGIVCAETRD